MLLDAAAVGPHASQAASTVPPLPCCPQITEALMDRVVDDIIDKIPKSLAASVFTLDWWASEFQAGQHWQLHLTRL